MKYSIDVHNNGISGWFFEDEKNTQGRVAILHRGKLISVQERFHFRNDLVSKGIHPTGFCGFLTDKKKLTSGNVYSVIISGCGEEIKKNLLFGGKEDSKKEFEKFELLPRDDWRYLELSTDDVVSDNSDLISIKYLMIRLRRGKRGLGSVKGFVGKSYQYLDSDWEFFTRLVENNLKVLINVLSTRSLASIVDTYADFGNPIQRCCALSVQNFMLQERFAQTLRCIYDFSLKNELVSGHQLSFGDGLLTNRLEADDAYPVFFARQDEILDYEPVIKRIFNEVLLRMLKNNQSILSENFRRSEHFVKNTKYYFEKMKAYESSFEV